MFIAEVDWLKSKVDGIAIDRAAGSDTVLRRYGRGGLRRPAPSTTHVREE